MRTTKKQPAKAQPPKAPTAPGLTFDEYVWLAALLGKLLKRDPGACNVTVYGHIKKEDQSPQVTLMTTRYVDGLMRMEDAKYALGGHKSDTYLIPVAAHGDAP